jgi:hypothetical protein
MFIKYFMTANAGMLVNSLNMIYNTISVNTVKKEDETRIS